MSERLQFHTFQRSSEKSNHLPLKKRPSQFDELLTLAEAEKQFILKTYEYTSGNKSQTAKILDVAIITVRKKLASYGVK
jgi:DNA-binding protein Fis